MKNQTITLRDVVTIIKGHILVCLVCALALALLLGMFGVYKQYNKTPFSAEASLVAKEKISVVGATAEAVANEHAGAYPDVMISTKVFGSSNLVTITAAGADDKLCVSVANSVALRTSTIVEKQLKEAPSYIGAKMAVKAEFSAKTVALYAALGAVAGLYVAFLWLIVSIYRKKVLLFGCDQKGLFAGARFGGLMDGSTEAAKKSLSLLSEKESGGVYLVPCDEKTRPLLQKIVNELDDNAKINLVSKVDSSLMGKTVIIATLPHVTTEDAVAEVITELSVVEANVKGYLF